MNNPFNAAGGSGSSQIEEFSNYRVNWSRDVEVSISRKAKSTFASQGKIGKEADVDTEATVPLKAPVLPKGSVAAAIKTINANNVAAAAENKIPHASPAATGNAKPTAKPAAYPVRTSSPPVTNAIKKKP